MYKISNRRLIMYRTVHGTSSNCITGTEKLKMLSDVTPTRREREVNATGAPKGDGAFDCDICIALFPRI